MPLVKQCKNGADSCPAKQNQIDYYTVAESTPENTYVYHCSTDWNDCEYKKISLVFPSTSNIGIENYQPLPGVSMTEFTLVVSTAWAVGRIVLLMRQMTLFNNH